MLSGHVLLASYANVQTFGNDSVGGIKKGKKEN